MRARQPHQLSLGLTPDPGRSALLTRPIPMADGTFLRTLAQARALTDKRKNGRFRDPWSRAEPLIAEAERTGSAEAVERVTGQVEMILLGAMEMKLG